MRIQETHNPLPTTALGHGQGQGHERQGHERQAPGLRTDARRNLRHVLNAARDVFGEQGYDAPIEEVARRARVGVGTVYRRFPNKEALVQFIAQQEIQRLTDRALEALAGGEDPWPALEGFVRFSAESGTCRLLPELFAATAVHINGGFPYGGSPGGQILPAGQVPGERIPQGDRVPHPRSAADRSRTEATVLPGETRELLAVLGRLVERARDAGQLRPDATVADVLLVIATAPPLLADPARQAAVSGRLLDLLLHGLRAART
jgi:AcrR family transcriptional regulator